MMKAKQAITEILEAIDEVTKLHPADNGNVTANIVKWKREINALPDWADIELDDDFGDDDTGVDADDVALAAGMRYKKGVSPVSGVMEPGIVNTPDGPKVGTGALLDNQPPHLNPPQGKPAEGSLDNAPVPGTNIQPPSPEALQAGVDSTNGGVSVQEKPTEDDEDLANAGEGRGKSGLKKQGAKIK